MPTEFQDPDCTLSPAGARLVELGNPELIAQRRAAEQRRGEINAGVVQAVEARLKREPGYDPSLLLHLSVPHVDPTTHTATAQLDLPACVPVRIKATNLFYGSTADRITSSQWELVGDFLVFTSSKPEDESFTTLAAAVAAAHETYAHVLYAGAKPGGGFFSQEEIARMTPVQTAP